MDARALKRSLPLWAPPETASAPAALAAKVPPRSVRISVTDRCDLACTYCRPSRSDGYVDRRLDLPAWRTVMEGLARAGVRRVRLTGGEPLVHPRVVELVALAREVGFDEIALTTNATQLEALAAPLAAAGLDRVNVSLDSLRPDRFWQITRGGELAAVLRGIDAARRAGLGPIKLNTVVLRGDNDDEIEAIVAYAWERGLVPRFLEVMPIAEGAKLAPTQLVTVAELRARLAPLLVDEEAALEAGKGPARYVRARADAALRVGFISGTSDTFCEGCDRLRVTSTGQLRPCLATDDGLDGGREARAGDSARFAARVLEAWAKKPDGAVWKGCTEATAGSVSMRAIGG